MAQDLNYDQAIDALKKLPEAQQRIALGKLKPEALKAVRQRLESPQLDFTNTIDPSTGKGYGIYRMSNSQIPGGWDTSKEVQVPYNKVKDALASGYKLHPDETQRWQEDSTHQGQGPTLWEKAKSAVMSSTEPTPDVSVRSYDPNHPVMSRLNQAGDVMQNVYQMPVNFIKAVDRGVYLGLPQVVAQTAEMLKRIRQGDPQGIQDMYDFLPPGIAQNLIEGYQRDEKQLGPAAALANFGGNIATLYAAGKIGGKLGEKIKESTPTSLADVKAKAAAIKKTPGALGDKLKGEINETLGTWKNTRRVVQGYGKEAEKARTDDAAAKKKYEEDRAEAENATKGREIAHKYDVHQKAQEMAAKYRQEVADTKAHNARTHAKAMEKHKSEAEKTRADNQRVMEQHAAEVKRVTEENKAAENALELRRAEEDKLRTAAQEQARKYADAEKKANDDNDAAWDKVRSKTAGYSTDISNLQKTAEIAANQADPATSALFKRIIKGEQPTLPNLTRTSTAVKYVDSAGNAVDRQAMSPVSFDQKVATGEYKTAPVTETVTPDDPGYGDLYERQFGEPPPVGGGPAQFNRLQRWYTYISDKMYGGGRIEAGLYNAYKMVRGAINDAMQDIAQQANATSDLENARKTHTEKMETFSDSPNEPQTVASKSLHEQTPEQVNEKARSERLNKVARYDPSILDTAESIDNIQKRLKVMKTEEQLRTSIRPVPRTPEVGDLRPGYNLSPNPVYQPPTVGDLRPGYELKPKPPLPGARSAVEAVKEPERVPPPKPPEPTQEPAVPNLQKENAQFIADKLREYGKWGQWVVRMMVGVPIVVLQHGTASSFGEGLLGGQLALTILTRALRAPSVLEWLAKPSAEDLKMIATLKPEDAARMREVLGRLAIEDAKRDPKLATIKPSPIMAAWLAGAASTQQQDQQPNPPALPEVKKRAEELQSAPSPAPPAQSQPAPGPESAIPLENLNKIIEQAQALRAKTGNKPPYTHIYDASRGAIVPV